MKNSTVQRDYWAKQHSKYAEQDWIDKPTKFAEFVIKYFPTKGKILELGAGQGQDSRFFTKKGYSVTSTDFSNHALELSKEKAVKANLNIDFQELDLTKPFDFKDKSFDIAYSHLAIHYFDNKITQNLINEIARILRPNGFFAFLVNTLEDPEIDEFDIVSEDLYKADSGIVKRYFSTQSVEKFTKSKFETVILDSKGETYKDKIKTLIRFIGKKK